MKTTRCRLCILFSISVLFSLHAAAQKKYLLASNHEIFVLMVDEPCITKPPNEDTLSHFPSTGHFPNCVKENLALFEHRIFDSTGRTHCYKVLGQYLSTHVDTFAVMSIDQHLVNIINIETYIQTSLSKISSYPASCRISDLMSLQELEKPYYIWLPSFPVCKVCVNDREMHIPPFFKLGKMIAVKKGVYRLSLEMSEIQSSESSQGAYQPTLSMTATVDARGCFLEGVAFENEKELFCVSTYNTDESTIHYTGAQPCTRGPALISFYSEPALEPLMDISFRKYHYLITINAEGIPTHALRSENFERSLGILVPTDESKVIKKVTEKLDG
ncbi:hypothetical protein [Spongorhabdus nitratireducens]